VADTVGSRERVHAMHTVLVFYDSQGHRQRDIPTL